MIKRVVLLNLFILGLFACKQPEVLSADEIINKSIEVSGGESIIQSNIDFNFRGIHYKAIRNHGNFNLGRNFIKNNDTIIDWLSNDGFERMINDDVVKVADSMVSRYSASVNSVHYFSVLPYGLHDAAVKKTYLKDVEIKGGKYHKIKVTFSEEGGGEDFEDVFMYFVNTGTFKVDYLAYSYNEDDGVGLRFREAYNERLIEGIRFVDYNNYKPKDEKVALDELEFLFEKGDLKLLSKIELKDINVTLSQL